MATNFRNSIRTVYALLLRDIRIMFYSLPDTIIDSLIIVGFIYFIYGHLMPHMGMNPALVTPTFIGMMIIVLINAAYDRAITDALDFDGARFVDYQITLPIGFRWLTVKYVLSYAINLFITSVPILIIGRLVFGSLLDFCNCNWWLFGAIYLLSMLLLSLVLFTLAVAQPLRIFVENTWPRYLLPMTMFGSLYYPWKSVNAVAPYISKIGLLMPSTYIVEGLRSAATHNPIYISAFVCAGMILALIGVMMFVLAVVMRRRFDPLG